MVLERPSRILVHKPPPFQGYWTASMLGCYRQMYLIALGIEGDFYDTPVLQEGRLHEDDIIARLQAHGITIKDRFKLFEHPSLPLKGHPDGRFVIEEPITTPTYMPLGRYLLEVKSMDRSFYYKAVKSFKFYFPHLDKQIQAYLMMDDESKSAYIIIKNRATGEITEFVLERDESVQTEIKESLLLLHAAVLGEIKLDFNQLDCAAPDSITARYCPYKEVGLCAHDTTTRVVTDEEAILAVQDYLEGQTLAKRAEELKSMSKRTLVEVLSNLNVKVAQIGGHSISLRTESRRSCDFDKLRETSAPIYDLVVSKGEYEKFDVR